MSQERHSGQKVGRLSVSGQRAESGVNVCVDETLLMLVFAGICCDTGVVLPARCVHEALVMHTLTATV